MSAHETKTVLVSRYAGSHWNNEPDAVAIEAPLGILLEHGPHADRTVTQVSITMRTPGHDRELAVGFLFTEGIIHQPTDIVGTFENATSDGDVITVALQEGIQPAVKQLSRNFFASSSCGVCGKADLKSIKTETAFLADKAKTRVPADYILQLPEKLRSHQEVFAKTGGLHACAVFDNAGDSNPVILMEDVGRHNALDKLIGKAFLNQSLPLDTMTLVLSGRISFELMQKANRAGIQLIAAVGAPSSLAVEMAKESNTTLVGFVRAGRMNVYAGAHRIAMQHEFVHG